MTDYNPEHAERNINKFKYIRSAQSEVEDIVKITDNINDLPMRIYGEMVKRLLIFLVYGLGFLTNSTKFFRVP